jgi:uncharacterized membrane protein YccC
MKQYWIILRQYYYQGGNNMWTMADDIIIIGLIGMIVCAIAVHHRGVKKGWLLLTILSGIMLFTGLIIKAFGG